MKRVISTLLLWTYVVSLFSGIGLITKGQIKKGNARGEKESTEITLVKRDNKR